MLKVLAVELRVAAGYIAAVFTGIPAAVLLMKAATFPPVSMSGAYLLDLPSTLFFGLVFGFVLALPGFVVAIVASLRLRWQGPASFVLAGAICAASAIALMHLLGFAGPMLPLAIYVSCLIGGAVGGLFYWLAAGRWIASRRFAA